jgi:hypothetical protein
MISNTGLPRRNTLNPKSGYQKAIAGRSMEATTAGGPCETNRAQNMCLRFEGLAAVAACPSCTPKTNWLPSAENPFCNRERGLPEKTTNANHTTPRMRSESPGHARGLLHSATTQKHHLILAVLILSCCQGWCWRQCRRTVQFRKCLAALIRPLARQRRARRSHQQQWLQVVLAHLVTNKLRHPIRTWRAR